MKLSAILLVTLTLVVATDIPASDELMMQSILQLARKAVAFDELRQAVRDVKQQGKTKVAVRSLTPALSEEDVFLRQRAAVCLAEFGSDAKPAIEELTLALKDDFSEVTEAAARALGSIGPSAREAGPALLAVIDHEYEPSRIDAAIALCQISYQVERAIPILLKELESSRNRKKTDAIRTLATLGEKAFPAKKLLMQLVSDEEHPLVRWAAIDALVSIDAKDAVPLLRETIREEDPRGEWAWIWSAAVKGLAKLGDEADVSFLVDVAKREHGRCRYLAINALGEMGRQARTAKPALREFLTDENEYNRAAAREALDRTTRDTTETNYQSLLKQFNDFNQTFMEKMSNADTPRQRATVRQHSPKRKFAPLFLAYAQRHPSNADTIQALRWVLDNGQETRNTMKSALALLTNRFADRQEMTVLLPDLHIGMLQREYRNFLHAVREKNEISHARQLAALCLAEIDVRQGARRALTVAEREASEQMLDSVLENPERDEIGQSADSLLFELRYLTVGRAAPEIVGVDADGQPFRLSDYRGKIVLLTFGGSWCQPCLATYPHKRKLLNELSGKPFEILEVFTGSKESLMSLRDKGQMTWRCFWDGPQGAGKIGDQYRVRRWPTIYVLDEKGNIRLKDVRGRELEQTIRDLVTAAMAEDA